MERTPTVTMLEFRRNAEATLRRLAHGQAFVLTYRGRPVARLEPIRGDRADADDPFYGLADLAAGGGDSLTDREIDALVQGS